MPVAIVAVVVAFFVLSAIGRTTAPPGSVSLSEALTSLVAIEDDFYAGTATSGLPVKIGNWFQYTKLDRRLEYEAAELPEPARSRALAKGKEAIEDLASIVEYSGYAPNGGISDAREDGRAADRFARDLARSGNSFLQDLGAKGLQAGRQALSDTVRIIDGAVERSE